MLQKILFIINPKSGNKKHVVARLNKALAKSSVHYDLILTEHPGHARELAQHRAKSFDAVVAVGGDGTINEVVNGLKNKTTLLGIVPIGTGNDFARSCHIPINQIAESVKVLLAGQVKTIDLGEVNGIRFINAVGVGFDGYANSISKRLSFIKGGLKYLLSIPVALIFYRFIKIKIKIDQQESQATTFMLCISNGKFVGNNLPVAPEAKLDDGLFEIIQMGKISRYRVITQFNRMLKGHINEIPEVKHQQATAVQIDSSQTLPAHYDGEILENTGKIEIKILPKAINLIC